MKYFVYIAVLLTLFACEKELEISEADFSKKLVLNTFLEADSSFKIRISSSVNTLAQPSGNTLNGPAQVLLKNGEIPIYNNTVNVVNGVMKLPVACVRNTSYTIEVAFGDFDAIRATDKVPTASPQIFIDTLISNGDRYTLRFSLKDSTIANKYLLQLYSAGKEVVGLDTQRVAKPLQFSTNDRLFLSNILTYNSTSSYALFDDDLLNGTTRTFEIQIEKRALEEVNYLPKQIVLQMNCVSENMYAYYVNLLENTHIYGGPLSSVSRHNGNVEKGLGAFCFYTASRGFAVIR